MKSRPVALILSLGVPSAVAFAGIAGGNPQNTSTDETLQALVNNYAGCSKVVARVEEALADIERPGKPEGLSRAARYLERPETKLQKLKAELHDAIRAVADLRVLEAMKAVLLQELVQGSAEYELEQAQMQRAYVGRDIIDRLVVLGMVSPTVPTEGC